MPDDGLLRAYAELVTRVGVHLRDGQQLHVSAAPEHAHVSIADAPRLAAWYRHKKGGPSGD